MKKNFSYKRTYIFGLTGLFVIVSFFIFMLVEKNSCSKQNATSFIDSWVKTQCNQLDNLQSFMPFLNNAEDTEENPTNEELLLENGESGVFSALDFILQTNDIVSNVLSSSPLFAGLNPTNYGLSTNDLEEMFSREIPYSRLIQFIVYWTLGLDTVIEQDFLSANNKSTVAKYVVNVIPYWIYLLYYMVVFALMFLGWMALISRFFSRWTKLESTEIFNGFLNKLFGITREKNKFLFPHYAPVIQKIMWLLALITALRIVQIFYESASTMIPFVIRNTVYYNSYQANLQNISQTATDLKEFYIFPFLLLFYGIFKVYPRFSGEKEPEYIKGRQKDVTLSGLAEYLNHKFMLASSHLRIHNSHWPEQIKKDRIISTNTRQLYRDSKENIIKFDEEQIQIRRLLDAFRIKELYPAQHEFIQKVLNKESVILAADRFSGKTPTVLLASMMEFLLNGKKTLFIVDNPEKGRILEDRFFEYFEDSFWIKQILKVSNVSDFENESNIEHTPDVTIATLNQWERVTDDILKILEGRKEEIETAKQKNTGKLFEQILQYQDSQSADIKAERRWLDFLEDLSLIVVMDLNAILFGELETVDDIMVRKFNKIMKLYSEEYLYFDHPTFAITSYPYDREFLLEIINNRLSIPVSESSYISYDNPADSNKRFFTVNPVPDSDESELSGVNLPPISSMEKGYIIEQPLAYSVATALYMDIQPILIIDSKYLISRRFLKIVKEIHSNLFQDYVDKIEEKVIFSEEPSGRPNPKNIKLALFAGEPHQALTLPYHLKYLSSMEVMALAYIPYSDDLRRAYFEYLVRNSDHLYKQKRVAFADMPNEESFKIHFGQDNEFRIGKSYLQMLFPPDNIFSYNREHYKVISVDLKKKQIRTEKNFEKYIIPSLEMLSSTFPFILEETSGENDEIYTYSGKALPINIAVKYQQNYGPNATIIMEDTLLLGNEKSQFNMICRAASNHSYRVLERGEKPMPEEDQILSRLFNLLFNYLLATLYEHYRGNLMTELHTVNKEKVLLIYDLFPDNQDLTLLESIHFELRNNIDSHSLIFGNLIRFLDELINKADGPTISGPNGEVSINHLSSIKDFLYQIQGRKSG